MRVSLRINIIKQLAYIVTDFLKFTAEADKVKAALILAVYVAISTIRFDVFGAKQEVMHIM